MDPDDFYDADAPAPQYVNGVKTNQVYLVDVVCSNMGRRNPFQIGVYCEIDSQDICTHATKEYIEDYFWTFYITEKGVDGIPFLNYHYNYYERNGGDRLDFLLWIENTFRTFEKNEKNWEKLADHDFFQLKKKYLYEWIKEKKPAAFEQGKLIGPTKKSSNDSIPKTFEELFHNPKDVEPCVEILRIVEPPLIDKDCNYIGKSKGALCVWMDEMKRAGLIKSYTDRKIWPNLLCKKINRFTINDSMFAKPHSRAEQDYKIQFSTLLSNVKLSQVSQKGKL